MHFYGFGFFTNLDGCSFYLSVSLLFWLLGLCHVMTSLLLLLRRNDNKQFQPLETVQGYPILNSRQGGEHTCDGWYGFGHFVCCIYLFFGSTKGDALATRDPRRQFTKRKGWFGAETDLAWSSTSLIVSPNSSTISAPFPLGFLVVGRRNCKSSSIMLARDIADGQLRRLVCVCVLAAITQPS